MNLFGHIGFTVAGTYTAERFIRLSRRKHPEIEYDKKQYVQIASPTADYRVAVFASLIPDYIDKPLALWIAPELVNNGTRTIAHTIEFALALAAIVLIVPTWRRSQRAWTLVFASAGHLVLDQMWKMTSVLLWPLQGWSFPLTAPKTNEWWIIRLRDALSIWNEPPELIGAATLLLFFISLLYRRKLLSFMRTGAIN